MKRVLLAIACLAVVVPASPAAATTVYPTEQTAEDFPDPDVVKVGDAYYSYATNGGRGQLPVASAASLDGPWTIRGDAMPRPDGWSDGWSNPGRTWAPDVTVRPDGVLVLTYTAADAASGRQCIGVATSSDPLGPFQPQGGAPIICPADIGGAIDANSFVASNGTPYLLWKNDGNAIGVEATIWLQQLTPDHLGVAGDPVALLSVPAGQIIEAPVLVQRPSQFVLFFAEGGYGDCNYATSYAVSSSLTGPYTTAYRPLMTTDTLDGSVCGPGGADVVEDRIVFHGWVGDARHLYTAALGWANDYPVVRGSRVRYEAEGGRLNHCSVRTGASGASQDAVVAYIDYADSWVELDVFVPATGDHTLHVGYANGSADSASHLVTVNGASQGTVSYPVTGWDNWQQAAADITLTAGWNTIRLTYDQLYAEVDYIEVN